MIRRVRLTHPRHRDQAGTLGIRERGKFWVHLDNPFKGHSGLPEHSVLIGRRYIEAEASDEPVRPAWLRQMLDLDSETG